MIMMVCENRLAATARWALVLSLAAPCWAGEEVLSLRLRVPPSLDTLSPVWLVAEWATTSALPAPEEPSASIEPSPRLELRNVETGAEVSRFSVLPGGKKGWIIPGFAQTISLKPNRKTETRYLLSEDFGIIPPGQYELTAHFFLTIPKSLSGKLPGREAPEFGSISGSSIPEVFWALPEQRVVLRVAEATKNRRTQLLARVQSLINRSRENEVDTDDWVALVLMNNEPAWAILLQNFDRLPERAKEMACLFLLNYGSGEQAIQKVRPLLASRSVSTAKVAIEVVEQRGCRGDASLLRSPLRSADLTTRRRAYLAVSRMLGKPIPPEIGRRPISEQDVQDAVLWLDASSPQAPSTQPTSQPREPRGMQPDSGR